VDIVIEAQVAHNTIADRLVKDAKRNLLVIAAMAGLCGEKLVERDELTY
jgi:hypothetical protein